MPLTPDVILSVFCELGIRRIGGWGAGPLESGGEGGDECRLGEGVRSLAFGFGLWPPPPPPNGNVREADKLAAAAATRPTPPATFGFDA